MTLSPTYKKQGKCYEESLSSVAKSIDEIFKIYDFVDKVSISGGEPLLHREIEGIIDYFNKYNNYYGKIKLHTNGTILPSKDLGWSNNNKLEIIIADYGSELSVNAEKLANYCLTNKINYRVNTFRGDINAQRYGGWIDYGVLTNKESKDEEYMYSIFSNCLFSSNDTIAIYKGKAVMCCMSGFAFDLGLCTPRDGDIVDLHSENLIELKKEQLLLLGTMPNAVCFSCNGCSLKATRLPSAQQTMQINEESKR